MTKLVALALAGLLTCVGVAALAQPDVASQDDPVAWEASQKAYLDWNKKQKGWKESKTGVQTLRTSAAGKGDRPKATDTVTIRYEGRLINGRLFDTSTRQPGGQATFPLPRLIKGWQEAIPLMRREETWEVLIPASMGYRDRTDVPVPPNSALKFQIELIDFEAAAAP
jgi:FKBP-type peptidyl-prolyl cis-trans isomerase FkpA